MRTEANEATQTGVVTALLWDVDNVCPPREHLASFAEALCQFVGPEDPLIAAAHRATFRSCQETLSHLGMRVLSGGRRRNGADRVLLDRAKALTEQGVERFLVASNDHRFTRIATLGELHVLTLNGDYVSQRLRSAAKSVVVLGRPDNGWQVVEGCGCAQASVVELQLKEDLVRIKR